MLDILKDKIKHLNNQQEKYNFLREFLQLLILKVIDEQGWFQQIAFMGGTALRIVFNLERFSEDLDFSLLNSDFDFSSAMEKLEKELELLGLSVDIKVKADKTATTAAVKFSKLLSTLGLSQLNDQKIFIKLELDQNPPSGANTELSLINKAFLLNIVHFDSPTLFAGKLHAVLCRKYTKGRDYYDLLWYLSRNISPNLAYLNSALAQQEGNPSFSDLNELSEALAEKLTEANFGNILRDVQPFLLDPKQSRFFAQPHFLQALKQWQENIKNL